MTWKSCVLRRMKKLEEYEEFLKKQKIKVS